ncbi:hypothetical protein GOV07_02175, partial [Candidatus Woesearchaeota archaeon]|nr:hypothetical protein [Candidatus Woesearchaeota archaeon]
MAKTNVLTILIALIVIMSATSVYAAHDVTITVDPDAANCNTLGDTFTITVENDFSSANNIAEVRIYEGTAGIVDFDCGPAPSGWSLFDFTADFGYCEYKAQGGNAIQPDSSVDFTFDAVMSSDACFSEFLISTLDDAQPIGEHKYTSPKVYIDCTLPVLTKTVGDPKVLIDPSCDPGITTCDYWIRQGVPIDISASDDEDVCDLGIDYCKWRVTLDGVVGDWTTEQNGPTLDWTIEYYEDSEHYLEIECYDLAGNMVPMTETEKVDDTPPTTTKEFFGPQKFEEGGLYGTVEWIDGVTTIELTATDGGDICAIGVDKTWYRISLVDDIVCREPLNRCNPSGATSGWIEWDGTPIGDIPESCHLMEFYSVDELGNTEDVQTNCFFVDKTPPTVTKTHDDGMVEGHDDALTETDGVFHWTTSDMETYFTCVDEGPHPSGDEVLCLKVGYDDADGQGNYGYITDRYCDGDLDAEGYCCFDMSTSGLSFYFNKFEESLHSLEYYCYDAVEKESDEEIQYYKVDDTPPTIEKVIFDPKYGTCPPPQGFDSPDKCYITDQSVIDVIVEDPDPTEMGCNSDAVECFYIYKWNGETFGPSPYFYEPGTQITFGEDSMHNLTITCYDILGNEVMDEEAFYVDLIPPETTKTIGDPLVTAYWPKGCIPLDGPTGAVAQIFDGGDILLPPPCGEEEAEWITSQTLITLESFDVKSGVEKIKWRNLIVPGEAGEDICGHVRRIEGDMCNPGYYMDFVNKSDPNWADWNVYDVPFTKNEDSCHIIEYWAVDNVGNEEILQWNCVFVDNQPPTMEKLVGEPQVLKGDDMYITQQTPITLTCTDNDGQLHPVDHVTFEHRYKTADECADLDGIAFPEEWTPIEGTTSNDPYVLEAVFNFPEDSCHAHEARCIDGLGNVGEVLTEIDIVDTVGPEINATIVGPWANCPDNNDSECIIIDGVTTIDVVAVD